MNFACQPMRVSYSAVELLRTLDRRL